MISPQPILLDSTVLIDALRNLKQRPTLLAVLAASGHSLAISSINIAEVHGGLRPGEEARTRAFLANFIPFSVTPQIAERAGQLQAAMRRQGLTLSINDMIVAATALENGLNLATDNTRHFQIPGLTLFLLP